MTRAEIDAAAKRAAAAGRRNIPVPISEWRKMMAARVGKVEAKALAKGKIKPVRKGSVSARLGGKAKADRTEKGLRKNREARK